MIKLSELPKKVLEPIINKELEKLDHTIQLCKKYNIPLDDNLKINFKYWNNLKLDMKFRTPEQERFIEDTYRRSNNDNN